MYFALTDKDVYPPFVNDPEVVIEEASLAEASHNNESVLPAAEQVIEVQPLSPSPLLPRSGGNPVDAIPEEEVNDPKATSTFKPKTFWVPEPPEGNSQLEWLSHWPEFFED